MSTAPTPPAPPSKSSPPTRGQIVLLVVLSTLGGLSVSCCGLCGGGWLLLRRSGLTIEQAADQISSSTSSAQNTANDWWAMQQLTQAYTVALDAVASDKNVTEALGEPIETVSDSAALFERDSTGELNPLGETIHFTIRGPKGKGNVVVHTLGNRMRGPAPQSASHPGSIIVALDDGRTIEVPVPADAAQEFR